MKFCPSAEKWSVFVTHIVNYTFCTVIQNAKFEINSKASPGLLWRRHSQWRTGSTGTDASWPRPLPCASPHRPAAGWPLMSVIDWLICVYIQWNKWDMGPAGCPGKWMRRKGWPGKWQAGGCNQSERLPIVEVQLHWSDGQSTCIEIVIMLKELVLMSLKFFKN